jgi:DNA-binding response OmpR family regulator
MAIRVLLAEPDHALVTSYQARLSKEGFEVQIVNNGLDCLNALHTFEPDVLVLEQELPWGGGDGVLDVMHDVYELPLVPVFIITSRDSFAHLDVKQFFRRYPLVTHMQTKPVGSDELVRLVQHIADEPKPCGADLGKPTLRSGKQKGWQTTFGQSKHASAVSWLEQNDERATNSRAIIQP